MEKQMSKLKNETGVTLVELLAAIAILSIIVTGFLGFFIQAAKTNQHTNKVNEATFLAQERMEEVIHLAETDSAETVKSLMANDYPREKNGYAIKTDIQKNGNLHKVIVTVSEGGNDRAKMETVLAFTEEKAEEEKSD